MTEAKKGEEVYNPFDPDTHVKGGGLWDGKVVTITKARVVDEELRYKDGTPVVDPRTVVGPKTKEPSRQLGLWRVGLALTGIAEDSEKERTEVYSSGDKLKPTADGRGFVAVDGGPVKFHASSNIAKLTGALRAAGFDLGLLYKGGKQDVTALEGAKFLMRAEAKLDRDGKPLKDKKGYAKVTYLPGKFIGYVAASGRVVGGTVGNGGDDLDAKADALVMAALADGGVLSRAELIRSVTAALKGSPDMFAVIKRVADDSYHKGKPWRYDGLKASL